MKPTRDITLLASLVAVIALAVGPASARKMAGVTMADQITVDGKTLVLNGMGKREATMLGVDVYVAGLYLVRRSSDPAAIVNADEPRRIHMVFVRDVDRDDITEAWTEGFEKNVNEQYLAGLRDRIKTFNSWMTKMRKRGTMTFTYLPGTGTIVEINGQRKGVIEGKDFGAALFTIWLGPKPPNAALKKGLLGGR